MWCNGAKSYPNTAAHSRCVRIATRLVFKIGREALYLLISATSLVWLTCNQTIQLLAQRAHLDFSSLPPSQPIEKCRVFLVLKSNQRRILKDNGNEHEISETGPVVFVSLSLAALMRGRQPSSSEFAIQQNSRKFSIRRVMRYSMFWTPSSIIIDADRWTCPSSIQLHR